MDFESVFGLLLRNFEKEKIRYALIGGLAMHAAGYVRSTADMDFLVLKEDMPKVKKMMLGYGYEAFHESEDVSTFVSPLKPMGRVDFLHAHRKYALAMLQNAKEQRVLEGKVPLKVVKAEDMIGLKVQSSSNDPSRHNQDMADIEEMIKVNKGKLNVELLKEYFSLFGRENELSEILKRADDVK